MPASRSSSVSAGVLYSSLHLMLAEEVHCLGEGSQMLTSSEFAVHETSCSTPSTVWSRHFGPCNAMWFWFAFGPSTPPASFAQWSWNMTPCIKRVIFHLKSGLLLQYEFRTVEFLITFTERVFLFYEVKTFVFSFMTCWNNVKPMTILPFSVLCKIIVMYGTLVWT